MLIGENCVALLCIVPKERQKIVLLDENTPLTLRRVCDLITPLPATVLVVRE